jgi:REP element-mobilizing transposase RayT
VHWVFVSRSRRRVFDTGAIDVPRGIFAEVCLDAQATRVEMDGDDDQVHSFTTVALSALSCPDLKDATCRVLVRSW